MNLDINIHEFGHQYFMGILASNEFEEAWMDEGMNTYFEGRIMDKYYGNKTSIFDFAGFGMGDKEMHRFNYVHNSDRDIAESYRNAWGYGAGGYEIFSYSKPATFLNTLQGLVGNDCMNDIMKTYYNKWKFKHPCSKDFIAVVNEVVAKHHKNKFGNDMNWFFDAVLYGNKVCDYKIDGVYERKVGEVKGIIDDANKEEIQSSDNYGKEYKSRVLIKREGDVVMPVELLVTFSDGQEIKREWDGKNRYKEFEFYSNTRIVSVEIDPEHKIMIDVNFANNSRVFKVDKKPFWKYTVKFLFWLQNLLQSFVWFV